MLTNRERFLRKYDYESDDSFSVADIARITKTPVKALQEVYNRGIGAWKSSAKGIRRLSDGQKDYSTSRAGKMSKEQWAMARVYSFVMGGTTRSTTDADIVREYGLTM